MEYKTKRYSLQSNSMGHYLLVRLDDCTHRYFQSEEDTNVIEQALIDMQYKENREPTSFDDMLDEFCRQYDHVLEP